ncbi:MAG: hypothetical protein PWP21_1241 [Thermosediminibacterales bacterium]|nr:hypothetical protein [Thermosediminibacterales bacterium]
MALTLKPLDLQILIHKTVQTSKTQKIEQEQYNRQQQFFSAEAEKSQRKIKTSISSLNKTEKNKIKKDDKQKNYNRNDQFKQQKTCNNKNKKNKVKKGNCIDILI